MTPLTLQLERLESAQLVRRAPDKDPSYLFKHALTQEVTYDLLLLKRRREVHRRVAQAYEQIYSDKLDHYAALLAQHYDAAGDDGKLVEYAIRAGDHAGRLSAEPEARANYALALQALARLPETDVNRRARIETLIKQTSVSFTSASPEQNLAYLSETQLLVESLLLIDPTSSEDRLRLARVQAWSARMHFFRQERLAALQDSRRVLPVARELGDEELATLVSTMMARIWFWGCDFNRALPLLQERLGFFEQNENWTEWILIRSIIGLTLAARGQYYAGLEEAAQAVARGTELRNPSGTATAYSFLAATHLMEGALESTLEASRTAVEISASSGNEFSTSFAWGTQAMPQSRLGEHPAARASIAQAEAAARSLGGHMFFDDWLAAIRVEMALNAGDFQETLARAEEAITFVRSIEGKFAEGIVRRTWGEALTALDPPRKLEAKAHLSQSLELFNSGGAVLEAARTHVAWGKLLQVFAEPDAAREHFEQAASQFQESNLADELNQVQRLLEKGTEEGVSNL